MIKILKVNITSYFINLIKSNNYKYFKIILKFNICQ